MDCNISDLRRFLFVTQDFKHMMLLEFGYEASSEPMKYKTSHPPKKQSFYTTRGPTYDIYVYVYRPVCVGWVQYILG